MKKFNSNEISYIQERACERITEILNALGIEFTERHDYLQFRCPCHNGDNERSVYWAVSTNHWKCMTHHCEKDKISGKSSSIFGLIRGAISNKINKPFYFDQAILLTAKILGLCDIKMDNITQEDIEINKIIKQHKKKQNRKPESDSILLSDMISKFKRDDIYYPKRGITEEIIDRYHISYCGEKGKRFNQRAFFPILDSSGKYIVGFSARSIWNKCGICNCCHNPKYTCPEKDRRKLYEKWIHSKGLKSEKYLYNYWFSKYHISKSGTAIVCESPGNVWSLEMAGINNSVAIMGSNMSKTQRQLLQKAGALTLILILDNDKAGKEATEKIIEELNYYFRIISVTPENVNDVAEMSQNEIINKIGSVLKNESKEFLLKDN